LHLESNLERSGCDCFYEQLADSLINRTAQNSLADRFCVLEAVSLAHVLGHQLCSSLMIADGHPLTANGTNRQTLQ
jgi:hypothetical protein